MITRIARVVARRVCFSPPPPPPPRIPFPSQPQSVALCRALPACSPSSCSVQFRFLQSSTAHAHGNHHHHHHHNHNHNHSHDQDGRESNSTISSNSFFASLSARLSSLLYSTQLSRSTISPTSTTFTTTTANTTAATATTDVGVNYAVDPERVHSEDKESHRKAEEITKVGMAFNVLLSVGKIAIGWWGHSAALLADGVHSLSDLISDAVTLSCLRVARWPRDEKFPFGYGKFESLGTLFVSGTLLTVSYHLVVHSATEIAELVGKGIVEGGGLSGVMIGAAVISIAIKEWLFRRTLKLGTLAHSPVVVANAYHHRSDALASLVALVGVFGLWVGIPVLDPIAGILVALLIAKAGFSIGYDSLRQLVDHVSSVDPCTMEEVRDITREVAGVWSFHNLRGRKTGPHTQIDMHVEVDPTITISAGNQVAERVRLSVLDAVPQISEVLVHIEPFTGRHPSTIVHSTDRHADRHVLLRPHEALEADVHSALAPLLSQNLAVSQVQVHYKSDSCNIAVNMIIHGHDGDADRIREVSSQARKLVEAVHGVSTAQIFVALDPDGCNDSSSSSARIEFGKE